MLSSGTKRGLFIVFEGGEGTGKSTQIKAMKAHFESTGREVVLSWEPGGTPWGDLIRDLVLKSKIVTEPMSAKAEALLMAASRAEHVEKKILPALDRGALVFCDRYWDASRAYQGVGRGLGVAKIDYVNEWATDGLRPDLVFVFDLDPKVGLSRAVERSGGQLDRMEQESLKFHQKVREAYLTIAKLEPERFVVLDASQSPSQLSAHILDQIKKHAPV